MTGDVEIALVKFAVAAPGELGVVTTVDLRSDDDGGEWVDGGGGM